MAKRRKKSSLLKIEVTGDWAPALRFLADRVVPHILTRVFGEAPAYREYRPKQKRIQKVATPKRGVVRIADQYGTEYTPPAKASK